METLRRALGSLAIGIAAVSLGTAAAQQGQGQGQQAQGQEGHDEHGLPTTQHQEEALRELGGDLLGRLDTNRDGSISRAEAQSETALMEKWDEYDRDRNQMLDRNELSAYQSSQSQSAEGEIDVAAGETVEGLPASPHQQEALRGELVELLDEDGDGKVSRDEAQKRSSLVENWEELDQNGDDVLDSTEIGRVQE